VASTLRLDSAAPWRRAIDLRYLVACLVGAVVSAAAAWAVAVGGVPLDVLPSNVVLGGACALLAVEWVLAGVLATVYYRRAPLAQALAEPAAAESAVLESAVLESAVRESAVRESAVREPAVLESAPAGPAVVVVERPGAGRLEDRIAQLTAALTLAASADNLHQVGVIVQEALAIDIRAAEET